MNSPVTGTTGMVGEGSTLHSTASLGCTSLRLPSKVIGRLSSIPAWIPDIAFRLMIMDNVMDAGPRGS